MNATDYQQQAARTLIDQPDFELTGHEWTIIINSIALSRTASSITELVKKKIIHRHDIDENRINTLLTEVRMMTRFFLRRRLAILPSTIGIMPKTIEIIWNTVGLLGEAGEVATLVMVGLLFGTFDRDKFMDELGDLLWYIAALCTKLDIDLSDVMQGNIDKLRKRYPNGYSSQDSQKRVDVKAEPKVLP